METIPVLRETFHTFEDNQGIYEICEQDILEFDIPKQGTTKKYSMSLFPQITSGDAIDVSGAEPVDPLE